MGPNSIKIVIYHEIRDSIHIWNQVWNLVDWKWIHNWFDLSKNCLRQSWFHIWILSRISWHLAILMESGLIIASLYDVGSIVASISGATTLCRHGSHGHHGCIQNAFRCCATLLSLLRFKNLIDFYCPPTYTRNSFSRNKPILATKHFAFDLSVEEIPSIFFGITYKDIHPILVVNLFTYALHTKI